MSLHVSTVFPELFSSHLKKNVCVYLYIYIYTFFKANLLSHHEQAVLLRTEYIPKGLTSSSE